MHVAFFSTSLGFLSLLFAALFTYTPKVLPHPSPGNKNGFLVTQGLVGEQDLAVRERKTRQEPEPCYMWQWWGSRKRTVLSPPSLLSLPCAQGRVEEKWEDMPQWWYWHCRWGGWGTRGAPLSAADFQGLREKLLAREGECKGAQSWRKSELHLLILGKKWALFLRGRWAEKMEKNSGWLLQVEEERLGAIQRASRVQVARLEVDQKCFEGKKAGQSKAGSVSANAF